MTGASNRFAHAAVTAVAHDPGHVYNPLWLYGPSGTGKTALLRAALEQIRLHRPELRIGTMEGEEFVRKLIHTIQTGSQAEFQSWLSDLDVLAVDHLDLLQGKVFTQLELAQVLSQLANRDCQVIVVSCCPPEMLEELHQSLRESCQWYLQADIQSPTEEERLAMVRQTLGELALTLPDPLIRRIVRQAHTHCRIRFILNQLSIRQKLLGPDAGSMAKLLDTLLERKATV